MIFIRKFGLVLGWLLIITVLLCIPGDRFPSGNGLFSIPQFDKYVHVLIFLILVWLGCRPWFRINDHAVSTRIFVMIAVLACLYGIIMEFVQDGLVPRRSFEFADILADVGGSILGLLISFWQRNRLQQING
jgi:VanZ family protein